MFSDSPGRGRHESTGLDTGELWGESGVDVDLINRAIRQLDLPEDAVVLDVGTGFGVMAISLALAGLDVTTGEPGDDHESPHRHEGNVHHPGHLHTGHLGWRELARKLGVDDRISYQRFDAVELPFPAQSFDAVFLYDTLQHIHDRRRAVGQCLRVARSGSVFCVIETSRAGIRHFRETEGFEIDFVDPGSWWRVVTSLARFSPPSSASPICCPSRDFPTESPTRGKRLIRYPAADTDRHRSLQPGVLLR